jgi:hypothetical protein
MEFSIVLLIHAVQEEEFAHISKSNLSSWSTSSFHRFCISIYPRRNTHRNFPRCAVSIHYHLCLSFPLFKVDVEISCRISVIWLHDVILYLLLLSLSFIAVFSSQTWYLFASLFFIKCEMCSLWRKEWNEKVSQSLKACWSIFFLLETWNHKFLVSHITISLLFHTSSNTYNGK